VYSIQEHASKIFKEFFREIIRKLEEEQNFSGTKEENSEKFSKMVQVSNLF
jgi:hypothetical protein